MDKIKPYLTHRIAIIFYALIAATMPFWFSSLDISVQSSLFDEAAGKWKFSGSGWAVFLYKFGTLPGLIAGALAIITLGAGFAVKKLEPFRKEALVIILALALGPGLLVNVISKSYTGRPRPVDIEEFGGAWKYRHALQFGVPGKGHSFPCGHCSMGFIFYAFYAAYRGRKKILANSALGFAAAYGLLMGAGRMAQPNDHMSFSGISF